VKIPTKLSSYSIGVPSVKESPINANSKFLSITSLHFDLNPWLFVQSS